MSIATNEDAIDVDAAAAIVAMNPQWVRKNALALNGVKIGRKWRFTRAGIAAGLDAMRQQQLAQAAARQEPAAAKTLPGLPSVRSVRRRVA